jgi:hypothetical protein
MSSRSPLHRLALATLVAAAPAHSATYNAASDWVDGSLNGPWSYGWDDGTSGYGFRAFDTFTAQTTYITWQYSTYITLSAPRAFKNTSGATWVGVADGATSQYPSLNNTCTLSAGARRRADDARRPGPAGELPPERISQRRG